ncbi:MAG: IS1 family transposase, partial [Desulfovibrio sp.]|nr:IS1 family transposase [Desulfovibrio sp.]
MQKLQVGIGSKKWLCTGEAAFPLQACGLNFVEGDARTNEKTAAKKAMCVILYSLGKASFNMLAHIFDSWPSLVYRWIMEAGAKLPESNVSGEVRQMEFGEMWHFIRQKKRKLWVIKAVDRSTRRTVAWVLGNRDTSTFMRLYQKVKHLNNCLFYTDQWEVFKKVLPPERHIIGKVHTR